MVKEQEKHSHYIDQERHEWCRKYKISGITIAEFAQENGLKRKTLVYVNFLIKSVKFGVY